ncbi:MAG TPA: hypothetical protein VMU48_17245 [Terracidiphilus sp.]|nr:hypothetical protein [Terracidiphilus sp.]
MNSKTHRVINKTQRSLLSPAVTVVDTMVEPFKAMVEQLAAHAEEGLWLKPYRGIPEVPGIRPFDLVLLDESHKVIGLAAAYPTEKLAPSTVPVASALVLPLRTIHSSLTHTGNQLEIYQADSVGATAAPASTSNPGWKDSPGGSIGAGSPEGSTAQEKPGIGTRILRWIFGSHNSRRAPRHALPDLRAFYWTGGAPQGFSLRDISATGFYLLTHERWTPGTVVLMTLQRTNTSGNDPLDSISVLVQVIRWGLDGMGFEFIMADDIKANSTVSLPGKGTDRKAIDQFLKLHVPTPKN